MTTIDEPSQPDLRFLARQEYSPKISDLVNMLSYTRQTTLNAVADLDTARLDGSISSHDNSIGALLAHIAAVEWAYGVPTFENRQPTSEEKIHWGPALRLGVDAKQIYKGHDLSFYLTLLAEVRSNTMRQLALRDDAWLSDEWTLGDGSVVNHHWAWFHVFEDELSHRGQILLIRKRLERNAAL